VNACWSFITKSLMWTKGIVFLDECIQLLLFKRHIKGRRPGGFCLQFAMHSFVSAILAWTTWIRIDGIYIVLKKPNGKRRKTG